MREPRSLQLIRRSSTIRSRLPQTHSPQQQMQKRQNTRKKLLKLKSNLREFNLLWTKKLRLLRKLNQNWTRSSRQTLLERMLRRMLLNKQSSRQLKLKLTSSCWRRNSENLICKNSSLPQMHQSLLLIRSYINLNWIQSFKKKLILPLRKP